MHSRNLIGTQHISSVSQKPALETCTRHPLSSFYPQIFQGKLDQFAASFDVQFALDIQTVGFDSAYAQIQRLRNAFVRRALRYLLEDLAFAHRERLFFDTRLGEDGHQRSAVINAPVQHRFDCTHDVATRRVLQHIASRARTNRLQDILGLVVHAEDQHGDIGEIQLELPRQLDATATLKVNVHQHQVDRLACCVLQGFVRSTGFRNDPYTRHTLQPGAHAIPDHRMIVHDHDIRCCCCCYCCYCCYCFIKHKMPPFLAEELVPRPPFPLNLRIRRSCRLLLPDVLPCCASRCLVWDAWRSGPYRSRYRCREWSGGTSLLPRPVPATQSLPSHGARHCSRPLGQPGT